MPEGVIDQNTHKGAWEAEGAKRADRVWERLERPP